MNPIEVLSDSEDTEATVPVQGPPPLNATSVIEDPIVSSASVPLPAPSAAILVPKAEEAGVVLMESTNTHSKPTPSAPRDTFSQKLFDGMKRKAELDAACVRSTWYKKGLPIESLPKRTQQHQRKNARDAFTRARARKDGEIDQMLGGGASKTKRGLEDRGCTAEVYAALCE